MRSVTSELSGRGNIQLQARRMGLDSTTRRRSASSRRSSTWSTRLHLRGRRASVELMFHRLNAEYVRPFELLDYFVITERRHGRGLLSEATVKIKVASGEVHRRRGQRPGQRPRHGLQDALVDAYPVLRTVHLTDYKAASSPAPPARRQHPRADRLPERPRCLDHGGRQPQHHRCQLAGAL